MEHIPVPLHSLSASILCMSVADKWSGSVASSSTQLDCVSHTKSWVGAPGKATARVVGWGLKCAEAQRGSICGCSSVNILCGMWKLCCTAPLKSAAAAEEIRAGLTHCWMCGAAWITAAVGFTLCSGLHFQAYDPHDVYYNWSSSN